MAQEKNSCGCCEGISAETPVELYNRPGLSAISYRVGDHAQFRESLIAALSASGLPALRRLTTRDPADFSIALLDAWSAAADVLTFYQERIANESYLGTATERFSILQLARTIGYELRPGVAASTYLAFTLEEASMAESQVQVSGIPRNKEDNPPIVIEAGAKVQSVPEQDEAPQTFETIETIEARAEWNAMKPRKTKPHPRIYAGTTRIVIQGVGNNLKEGDVLLIGKGQGPNDAINIKDSFLRRIVKITLNEDEKTTTLLLDADERGGGNSPSDKKAKKVVSDYVPAHSSSTGFFYLKSISARQTLGDILQNGIKYQDLILMMKKQGLNENELKIAARNARRTVQYEDRVFVFRKRAAVFGYNAPLKPVCLQGKLTGEFEEWRIDKMESAVRIYLDSEYPEILPGSYIMVQHAGQGLSKGYVYQVKNVETVPRAAYGISLKSTAVDLSPESTTWWKVEGDECPPAEVNRNGHIEIQESCSLSPLRSIAIHAQSEALQLAEVPIEELVSEDTIRLDTWYSGLEAGQMVILSGERSDWPGVVSTELRTLSEVRLIGGLTKLKLNRCLDHSYVRNTFVVNANVARANHGESVQEVLGSGDSTLVFQSFELKQPPLTYTSAANASGAESSLEIRVNDLLWHEAPSFYGRGPTEHIYTLRHDEYGKTTVTFGDGKNGARLPSGQQNVTASYRKGIGLEGMVNANQLSQLLTRPLGVKAVTNPMPATGAQGAEHIDEARRNATLTIYTLDRIVSLQDYEDFARAFAGIAKAQASAIRHNRLHAVLLTLAGYEGTPIEENSEIYENLLNAIHKLGLPKTPVYLRSYQPRHFCVAAKIKVHPDYLEEKVIAAAEQALAEHFSFEAREFGQAVAMSEAIALLQNVEGVLAVDMGGFHDAEELPGLSKRIVPKTARVEDGELLPAELLYLDPGSIKLTLMP